MHFSRFVALEADAQEGRRLSNNFRTVAIATGKNHSGNKCRKTRFEPILTHPTTIPSGAIAVGIARVLRLPSLAASEHERG